MKASRLGRPSPRRLRIRSATAQASSSQTDALSDSLGSESPLDRRASTGYPAPYGTSGFGVTRAPKARPKATTTKILSRARSHREETLQEHLIEQLSELSLSAHVRALAETVIQNLNRDGFHIVPPEELPCA